jgi:hypothetical protein
VGEMTLSECLAALVAIERKNRNRVESPFVQDLSRLQNCPGCTDCGGLPRLAEVGPGIGGSESLAAIWPVDSNTCYGTAGKITGFNLGHYIGVSTGDHMGCTIEYVLCIESEPT